MKRARFPGLLLLLLACVSNQPAAQTKEWRTYHNEKFGYELQYLAGWNVTEARPRTGSVRSPGVFQRVTFEEHRLICEHMKRSFELLPPI